MHAPGSYGEANGWELLGSLQFGGWGRALPGYFHMALGNPGTSMRAEMEFLDTELATMSQWLRMREINFYGSCMALQAGNCSFFNGIAFRALTSGVYGFPKNSPGDLVIACVFLVSAGLTYGLTLMVVFISSNSHILSLDMWLRGPEGGIDRTADGLRGFTAKAFVLYTLGMSMFFVTAALSSLKRKLIFAIPMVVTIAIIAGGVAYYAFDIKKRFHIPEAKLTTGKIYFFSAQQRARENLERPVDVELEVLSSKDKLQSFCMDCGARFLAPMQQFCTGCGAKSERLQRLQRDTIGDEKTA